MRLSGIMLVTITLVACRSEPSSTPSTSATSNAFENNLVWLRGARPALRQVAAAELVIMCCPDRVDYPPHLFGHGPEACQELSRFIDREHDPFALAGAFLSWGPSCYEAIPLRSVLGALPRARDESHAYLVLILARMDPAPEIVSHLTQRLDTTGNGVRLEAALASYGESDLGPVVDALRDPRVLVRRRAALALSYAFSDGPLDLPEGVAALERALRDPDRKVADNARQALWGRDQAAEKPLDWYVEKASEPYRIQLLARRRAFCQSKAATEVLERLARDEHLTTAYLAKRAIALRERRCAEAASSKRQ
jgi:hypothetical protein